MDAFDADVLIYAAVPGHPLGEQVAALFRSVAPATMAGTGSVLLLPEILARPLRDGATDEVRMLAALLARLDLRPVDRATAELATALSSRYRLKAADAVHLATAVAMGADRFITNNRRDFPATITEIQVTYPTDLASAPDSDTSSADAEPSPGHLSEGSAVPVLRSTGGQVGSGSDEDAGEFRELGGSDRLAELTGDTWDRRRPSKHCLAPLSMPSSPCPRSAGCSRKAGEDARLRPRTRAFWSGKCSPRQRRPGCWGFRRTH